MCVFLNCINTKRTERAKSAELAREKTSKMKFFFFFKVKIYSKRNEAWGWMEKRGKMDWMEGSDIVENNSHVSDATDQEINEK